MKKFIILIIIHYSLLINISFSQSSWILQSPLPTSTDLYSVKYFGENVAIIVGGLEYTSRSGIILRTTNGGIDWTKISTLTSRPLYDVYVVNANTGFAVGDSLTILKTTNAGENWFSVYNNNSSCTNYSVYFINENTGFIHNDSANVLKTTNCGNNWSIINTGVSPYPYRKIYFLNENTGFITYGAGLLKSTNGGLNWSVNSIGINNGGIYSIYFTNESTGFVVGYNSFVAKTTNSGLNWFLISYLSLTTLNTVFFVNENTGFTAGDNVIFRTTNQGINWDARFIYSYMIRSIDFVSESKGMLVGGNGTVAKTENGGINWEVTSSGTCQKLTNISLINQNVGFAVGDEIVLETTNAGSNWKAVWGNWYDDFENLFIFNENNLIASTGNTVYKSINGGENWIIKFSVIPPDEISDIHFPKSTVGYLSCTQGIYKTLDSSEYWSACSQPGYVIPKVFFINESTGYGASYSGLTKTTNGGFNWNIINTSINGYVSSFLFIDSMTGFITQPYSNIISKTTNGGVNWINKIFSNLYDITSMFFINKNTGFLSMQNGPYSIAKTTNAGNNWILQNTGDYSLNTVKFLDTNIGYGVGENGVILKTTNGGSVWVSNYTQEIPKSYELFQNYPNPFNPNTTIRFQIKDSRFVTLKVYNILGKEITTLVNEKKSPGIYDVRFDGNNLSTGIYFYSLFVDGVRVDTKKMVMIK